MAPLQMNDAVKMAKFDVGLFGKSAYFADQHEDEARGDF